MKQYAFIGFGLIGGSIARRLKKLDPNCKIHVMSRTKTSILPAIVDGVVDEFTSAADSELITQSDIIFLCTPVTTIANYLDLLAGKLSPNTILTDVGSTKKDIMDQAIAYGHGANFIGGHPMAGSEKTGYVNSREHLLENAFYILTPGPGVTTQMVDSMKELASTLGAIPMIMNASEHDYCVAAVSHVPHLIAAALVELVENNDTKEQFMRQIAAGGFKDITRIASSSPEMWEQICLTNVDAINDLLDKYIASLTAIKHSVAQKNGTEIAALFESSGAYRSSIEDGKTTGPIPAQYCVYCDIADETGAIATIATVLAIKQINIKNIGIVHNRESEEGVLKIEFYDQESMKQAIDVLKGRSYTVFPR